MSLSESKDTMTNFYDRLEAARRHDEHRDQILNSRGVKLNKIHEEESKLKEACARDLLVKIYRDALPIDEEYKASISPELDNGVIRFITKRTPSGKCFGYVLESKERGSIPAKKMVKAIEESVHECIHKFYENMGEKDYDEIIVSDEQKNAIVDGISTKMDYPEISKIIQANVQETVRNEIQKSKEEKEKMDAIQQQLASDESVATTESVDDALRKNGFGTDSKPYQPSLFTGIMAASIASADQSLDPEHIEKQAFCESVKEYTKYCMLSVMDMEKFDEKRLNYIATQYARKTAQ